MVMGATDRIYCIETLMIIFFFGGIPYSWGIRLALSLRPEKDLISQLRSYIPTEFGALNLTLSVSRNASRQPALL